MINKKEIQEDFPSTKLFFDEPLAPYTYTKTGGRAEVLAIPRDKHEARDLIRYAYERQLPLTFLGNASNVLIQDGGLDGIVIMLSQLQRILVTENGIIADAGASLIEVTQQALRASLTGLEFACGIPGSVGGAAYMNAGAYGGEVSEVIRFVEVLTPQGEFVTYTKEDMAFGYRKSYVQESGDLVISVAFELEKGNQQAIQERMNDLTQQRQAKQPLELPSCGSVFKRPEGYFAGKLIQDAGLQGWTSGGAQVSTKHAGFIVNINQATASDYLMVIHHIQETVFKKFGVKMEPEVRIIGKPKE